MYKHPHTADAASGVRPAFSEFVHHLLHPQRSPLSAQSSLHSTKHFCLRIQQVRSDYISSSRNHSASAAATELLQQAATSQKVQPYLALGAALWVEQNSACKTDTLADLDGRWQLAFASTSSSTLFCFSALVITVFERTVLKKPISFAEKVYTYYWLHEGLACARSSGGGIVLLRRLQP
ncbi:hypothetical protein WJX79_000400 [Trebouxia sp. C0005]